MKKKSVSQSASLNVRVLIVPVLFVAGVFLALFGNGIFSSAEARSPNQAQRANNQLNARGLDPTPTPCAILAYISNTSSANVSVIDTSNNTVVATVPVFEGFPGGVAVNPAGTRVYVTDDFSNTVSVIDTSSNTVVAIVAQGIGGSPEGVAVTPDGTRAYVANYGNGNSTVSVIDTSNNTVVATVQGLFYPYGVAMKPDGTRVYVTNSGSNHVSVIDTSTNTVVGMVPVPLPLGVAVTPDGTRGYVTTDTSGSHLVSVFDTSTNTVVATVTVGSQPYAVAINPAGTRAYVTNLQSNNVSVIDTSTNTVVATVPVGSQPYGVSVTPDGTRAYVANYFSNTVSVIDTSNNTVVATVAVGSRPNAFGNFIAAVPCPSPTPTPTPTPTPHPCQLRALIVYADTLAPAEFQWEIQNEPNVTTVDLFDAVNSTPTLAQLQQYDIVVPLSNYSFQDSVTLGNSLADYVDGGGVVVEYGLSHSGSTCGPSQICGRWVSGNYNPYYSFGRFSGMPFTLGTFNAAHPLMTGVTALNSDSANTASPVGSTEVAQMNNGDSLVAFRQVSGGHTTVGVTGYVGDYAFQSGDWGKVVVNAGNWLYNCQPGGTPTPTPTCKWQLVSPMPVDSYGAAGASDGTYFYAAGGYSWTQSPHNLNVVYRWSLDPPPNGSWTTLAPMPQAATVATAVYYPPTNRIYVFGGLDPDSGMTYNITQIYDIASNTWSTGAPMPDVRNQSAGGYSPATGQIYILSGDSADDITTAQQNTWAYDPVADSWTDLTVSAPFPHPAGGFAYGVINNKLYIAGGRDANNQLINLTWEYDPVANTYTQKADEPSSFQNNVPGSAVASDLLWVFGGGNPFSGPGSRNSALPSTKTPSSVAEGAFPLAGVERFKAQALPTTDDSGRYYDPVSDTWTSAPDLAVARSFPSSGAIGNRLLIAAGGYNGAHSVHTVQKATVCVGTPMAQSAFSRKIHGAAGTFDVPLPLTGNVGIECRSGGGTNDYQMIINFAISVTVENALVTSGTGSVSSFSVNGSQVTVNLTGVTNVQRITVTLFNVNDGTHRGNVAVSMGVLVGDVNGNGAVNATDVALTKSQVGMAVGSGNFREDVNANGTISSTDVAIVKSDVGTSLPP